MFLIEILPIKVLEIMLVNGWTVYDVLEKNILLIGRKQLMEFIFVKTEEFKEFERDIERTIKYIKHNAIKTIVGSFLFYLSIVALIILLP